MTNHLPENKSIESGHEPLAIDVRAVWITAMVLIGVVAMTLLLMAGLRHVFGGTGESPPALADERNEVPLPATIPALDAEQAMHFDELRRRQDELLQTYEWIDRQAGVARIPIERAMDLIAERGLPATPPGTTTEVIAPPPIRTTPNVGAPSSQESEP